MNSLIEQYADQCTDWVTGTIDGDYEKFDHKKFAALILNECCGVVNEHIQHNNTNDCLLVLKIKEHFGVNK